MQIADPLCYDALKALTAHHLLSEQQERELLASLPLSQRCSQLCNTLLVTTCYLTKLNKCALDSDAPATKFSPDANTTATSTSTTTSTETNTSKSSTLQRESSINNCSASGTSPANNNTDKCIGINLDELPAVVSKLSSNLDIITARAERLYYKCKFVTCFQLTRSVLEQDPYHSECLPIHIACLIELQQSNALFLLAHKLVDLYPETALAWFAVGAYYYLIGKNELSRRFLSKATSIDKVFGPAWIAFAHSFAAENEHDQASAAYFKVR